MKKKILQTGLGLFLSLALLPSCKEDITNAEDNKIIKYDAPPKTYCKISIQGIIGYPTELMNTEPSWFGVEDLFQPAEDTKFKSSGDTLYCSYYTGSSSGSGSSGGFPSSSSESLSRNTVIVFDTTNRIIKKLYYRYSSSKSSQSDKLNSSYSYRDKEVEFENLPYIVIQDSVISVDISGIQLNSKLKSCSSSSSWGVSSMQVNNSGQTKFFAPTVTESTKIQLIIK